VSPAPRIEIIPITGIPEVVEGDDLAAHIAEALATASQDARLVAGDIVVVTQKVVSKAAGRLVGAGDRMEAALAEAKRVVRKTASTLITETRHGHVCANSGVDDSNVAPGYVSLLPLDPDLSARRIRARLGRLTGVEPAVVISDTFGRAWRLGQTDIAIGVAGMDPFLDYRGELDANGKVLVATQIAVADEIAGAAEMVMGKSSGVCAAVVRGAPIRPGRGTAAQIIRPVAEDLFR